MEDTPYVPIRAGPVLCAAWGLSLALVLAIARGWPPEPRYLAVQLRRAVAGLAAEAA